MSSRVSGQCSYEFMDGKIRSQCSILNCGVFISTLRAFISLHKWFVSSPYTTSVVSSIEYIYMDTKFKKGNSWTNWSGNKIDVMTVLTYFIIKDVMFYMFLVYLLMYSSYYVYFASKATPHCKYV